MQEDRIKIRHGLGNVKTMEEIPCFDGGPFVKVSYIHVL